MTDTVLSVSPLLTLYFEVSGLWFHSHSTPIVVPAKVSVPVCDLSGRDVAGRL